MPARVIQTATATRQGSGSSNQDRAFTLPNALILLDGASAQETQQRDGGWHAHTLGSTLHAALRQPSRSRSLRTILRDAIAAVVPDMGIDRPSSAVGLARWGRTRLDLLVLGDITAVVYLTSGQHLVLCDDRLDGVAPQLRQVYQGYLRSGHGFDGEHRARLAALQAAQRARRNTDGGYWIAEADPAAAAYALSHTVPAAEVAALLMVTDGIADAVNVYRLFGWPAVRRIVTQEGPEALIDQICRAERADREGRRWPRGKVHDDKSLVFTTFTQVNLSSVRERMRIT